MTLDGAQQPQAGPQPSPMPSMSTAPASSDRPKVIIEDPHPAVPKNPLKPYVIASSAAAGVLLAALLVSIIFQSSSYDALDARYNATAMELTATGAAVTGLESEVALLKQELALAQGDQATLTTALNSAHENLTDKMNELAQCTSALLLAQGEITRLNALEATKCDTMVAEFKQDCNLAIDQLFTNLTMACEEAVEAYPNATASDIRDRVEDMVDADDYKFPT
jgi:hypothetical protein